MELIKAALKSCGNYLKLVANGNLHLHKDRLKRAYHIGEHGEYSIFRETVGNDGTTDKSVVLVVGFRLKLLGSSKLLHALFQKLCILTTPFWSGFRGFRIKLWMIKHKSGSYLGIYEWAGMQNAQDYVEKLERVLKPLSIPNSVWHAIYSDDFEKFLEAREYKLP